FFFFQAEDGIRDGHVTGVQTCALPICHVLKRIFGGETSAARYLQPSIHSVNRLSDHAVLILRFILHLIWLLFCAHDKFPFLPLRSEERRVGKECRARWWVDE